MRCAVFLFLFFLPVLAQAQTYNGELRSSDSRLDSGEYSDTYEVRVRRGQTVSADLNSSDFDPYLILIDAGGERAENDDCTSGDLDHSCTTLTASANGIVRVVVTSYAEGETGRYRAQVSVDGASNGSNPVRGSGGILGRLRGGNSQNGSSQSGGRGRDNGSTVDAAAERGELRRGDDTRNSGEYVDAFTVQVRSGDRLNLQLFSDDFDPYLIATSPSGDRETNDDCTSGDLDLSCLDFIAREGGTWTIAASSFSEGATGQYRLSSEVAGRRASLRASSFGYDGGNDYNGDVGNDPSYGEQGELSRSDNTRRTGEYADQYTLRVRSGDRVRLNLGSNDFDSYLIATSPSGRDETNDDCPNGEGLDSCLDFTARESGEWRVYASSFSTGGTGRYTLSASVDGRTEALRPSYGVYGDDNNGYNTDGYGDDDYGDVRRESGTLSRGDRTLTDGEYYDTFTFTGTGGRVPLDLRSDDFDTFLLVRSSDGTNEQNDDFEGETDHSRLVIDTRRGVRYTVTVTSFRAGETGRYDLSIGGSARFGAASSAPPESYGTAAPHGGAAGEAFRGALDRSDNQIESGEYADAHSFQGAAGEPVRVEMESRDFDTYLIVRSPSGEQVENDDYDGSTDRSVVEFIMPESGRYNITATSYQAGETGRYTVRVSHEAMQAAPSEFDRIVGVFVGISDYDRPGLPPLRYTARDAQTAHDAMVAAGMNPRDGILLQDRDATVSAVRRAFQRLGREADGRTQFVFFYSGHGGQYASRSFSRQDPDGMDESIELYDAPILDDELDQMLSGIPAGRELIVLDACYSGGFAKDIISHPNRMGMFSSEEDVVSQVAARFEAGGYLSQFFSDAVTERAADTDRNGAVTALEMSQYIHDRYDQDVQGAPRGLVSSGDTGLHHQKFVVDRGSVGLSETLFVLNR